MTITDLLSLLTSCSFRDSITAGDEKEIMPNTQTTTRINDTLIEEIVRRALGYLLVSQA